MLRIFWLASFPVSILRKIACAVLQFPTAADGWSRDRRGEFVLEKRNRERHHLAQPDFG